jgi:hypothetical protein
LSILIVYPDGGEHGNIRLSKVILGCYTIENVRAGEVMADEKLNQYFTDFHNVFSLQLGIVRSVWRVVEHN